MNIIKSNNPSMDVLSEENIKTMTDTIVLFDKHAGIDEINYETGRIILYHDYNTDSENEFRKHDFMEINVSAESIPCMFWEVTNALFKRCM